MKKVLWVLVVVSPFVLTGCPELGLGTRLNTLVIHNQDSEYKLIDFISVVRVPDECSRDEPEGINLLPEPIVYGETFQIKNLEDGRYYCFAENRSSLYNSESGYVTLSGGTQTDWYVTDL